MGEEKIVTSQPDAAERRAESGAAAPGSWREVFLAAGVVGLATRPGTGGALIDGDLSREKIALLKAHQPLARAVLRP